MPSQTIVVDIVGDAQSEADETFFVNLSNPSIGVILDGVGLGTITNDDAPPVFISIDDVTQAEGNSGTTSFNFTVALSAASSQSIIVKPDKRQQCLDRGWRGLGDNPQRRHPADLYQRR